MILLNEISKMQNVLDQKILDKHNLTKENTYDDRVIALLVELGELANETRYFKYWSNKGPSHKDVILEEYVDGIHFIISIGNTIGVNYLDYQFNETQSEINDLFLELYNEIPKLINKDIELFNKVLSLYLNLGYNLGFDLDIIKGAYDFKNNVNHERQENGY